MSPSLAGRSPDARRSLRPLLLVLLAAACDDDPTTPGPPNGPVQVESLAIEPAASPLARHARVRLSGPDGIRVVYTPETGEPLAIELSEPLADHTVPLARLYADTEYRVEVHPLSVEQGAAAGAATAFRTEPLPADLAALVFEAEGTPSHPLALLEITQNGEEGWEGIVMVDAAGGVVGYRRGSVAGSTRRSNGNFVLQTGTGLTEITPTGSIVNELARREPYATIHHDVVATPSNTVLFLARDERVVGNDTVAAEAVWEWDPEAGGEPELRWSAWDALSWEDDQGWNSGPEDWLHANSLWVGPGGNVLVSFAWLDQVISIAPDFEDLEWRLGGPNATIVPPADGTFHFQHTASELPPSAGGRRILLFDNGADDQGFSRALELEIDPHAGTAEKVWEFVPPNLNKSQIVSLARRLDNGNTFVAFGASDGLFGSHGPVEVYEVGPGGSVLWNLRVAEAARGDPFVLYRAWPVVSLAGEAAVEEGRRPAAAPLPGPGRSGRPSFEATSNRDLPRPNLDDGHDHERSRPYPPRRPPRAAGA